MRSRFTKATATSVLVVLVLVSFTWLAGTRDAVALVVVGEDYGLRVSLAEALTPTDNLAPEDTQTSKIGRASCRERV